MTIHFSGVGRIAAERQRQIEVEGWTWDHDDEHEHGELAAAACCYAAIVPANAVRGFSPPSDWPWDAEWWKPKSTGHANDRRRIEDLARAGALIAAEIDRLLRQQEGVCHNCGGAGEDETGAACQVCG